MSLSLSISPPYMQPDDYTEENKQQLLTPTEQEKMKSAALKCEDRNPENNMTCRHQCTTVKVKSHAKSAYIWAFILFVFVNRFQSFLSIVPFCIEDLKETTEYCQKCKKTISSTQGRSIKRANYFLGAVFLMTLLMNIKFF